MTGRGASLALFLCDIHTGLPDRHDGPVCLPVNPRVAHRLYWAFYSRDDHIVPRLDVMQWQTAPLCGCVRWICLQSDARATPIFPPDLLHLTTGTLQSLTKRPGTPLNSLKNGIPEFHTPSLRQPGHIY